MESLFGCLLLCENPLGRPKNDTKNSFVCVLFSSTAAAAAALKVVQVYTLFFYRSILFYSSLFCSYHKSHEYFYSKPSVRRGVFFSPPALKKGIAFPSSLSSSSFPSPGFLFPNLAEVDGTICFIEGVRSRADRDGVRLLEVIRRSD